MLKKPEVARAKAIVTVEFAASGSSRLGKHTVYCICVPSDVAVRIQESHILVGHILCEVVEAGLATR